MTLTFTGLTLGSTLDLEPDAAATTGNVKAYLYNVSPTSDPIRVYVSKKNSSDVWGFDDSLGHPDNITYNYDGMEEMEEFWPETITSAEAHADTYTITPISFAGSRNSAISAVLRFGLFDGTNTTIFQITFTRY